MNASALLAALRHEARPLHGLDDVAPIVELLGGAEVVLLGEATHGSHEFYRLRAEISKRLVLEHGFDALAVEADWPDALRVSRYLRGDPRVHDPDAALGGFVRFPRWMWRNQEVRELVQWLRRHNEELDRPSSQVGFFGLDVYSLRGSMDAVLHYLQRTDPALADQARRRYACFDDLAADPQRYGYETRYGLADDCEQQAVQQLQEMLVQAGRLLQRDGADAGDELFYAQQNARVVQGAEQYYRLMYRGDRQSWNLRDTHMADTLQALRAHLGAQRGRPARVVVWAHNSHIGDARATEMGRRGELNLGQLLRQRSARPGECVLLGFTTHTGTVAAASDWDEPVERKHVRPSLEGSVERLLHDSGLPLAVLPLQGALREALAEERLERAIGVIYRPDTERWSHYFGTRLSQQFDAVVHVDRSHALRPLDPSHLFEASSAEETFPSGL